MPIASARIIEGDRRRRGALFCSRLSKADDDDDDDGDDNDCVETDFVGGELLSRRRRVRRLFLFPDKLKINGMIEPLLYTLGRSIALRV